MISAFSDYKTVLDKMPDSIFLITGSKDTFTVIYENDKFHKLTRGSIPLGSNIVDYLNKNIKIQYSYEELEEKILHTDEQAIETTIETKDTGHLMFLTLSYYQEKTYLGVIRETVSINKIATKIQDIAYTDYISGLPNRACFYENYKNQINKSKKDGSMFALMLLDLDNMKNINDANGHAAGDELIRHASQMLHSFEKDCIKAFRYGDDEFILLISDITSRNFLITIADTILETFNLENIEVSGGITVYPDDSKDDSELLKYADIALYDVKANGKNAINFFQSIMYQKFSTRVALEYHMNQAFTDRQFQLYFQPQFDIRTNALRGFEALIRWYDKDLGWISPEKFIPVAEESHLVVPIGSWVLEKACSTLHDWQKNWNFTGIMSVNVSPLQLKKADFVCEVLSVRKKYNIDPKALELEINEGVMIANPEEIISILQQFKDKGFGISLDDFGTGYSSLHYLQMLPLTTLKIDKSFVTNLMTMQSIEANITDSIISMVSKIGLDTIAEGVEHQEQLHVLKALNCHNIQGFLKGKPMPKEECEKSFFNRAFTKNIEKMPSSY
ncbi:MAG: bifunctional diguanylate cyclase/phosphodiesterase [Treponema sp.]|nr:bifunctional diguanylate cyclase/phosphodiesterase [Treponema sp.]